MTGFRKLLGRPGVSLTLLCLLLYSLWRVPTVDTSDCSVRGWSLPALKIGKAERISAVSVFLVRDGNSFRVEDLDKASSQGLIDALKKDPDDIVRAHLYFQRIAGGLYDITSFTDQYELELRPISNRTLSSAEASTATAAFAGWLSSKDGGNRPGAAEAIRGISPTSWKPCWLGVAHTALAAIGWLLFLASLSWVPVWWNTQRKLRRAEAIRHGRCPSCGYDIYGLQRDVCPECGKLLQA